MRQAVLTIVAVLAAIYAVFVTWRQNERAAGLDFYIYFVNAQLAGRTDVANIYDADEQARIGEEYYERAQRSSSELHRYDAGRRRFVDSVSSPFLYTTLRWVSRDYDRALRQYHVLVLLAFVTGVLLIGRRVGMRWSTALFLLAALLLWYRGFEADLRVGNVNSLQLAAIGAALSVPPLAAGAIAGMLVAFKPNLILIPLLLLVSRIVTRDWLRLKRELAGGATGVVIAIVAAALNYGTFNVWLQWVSRANEFYHRLPTRMERNVTPALALFHQHGAWVSYVIALVLTALVCAAILRGRRRDDVLVIGAAILIYLLSATVVWLHYMVLVVVAAFGLTRWKATAVVAAIALLLIAEEPYELLTRQAVYPNDAMLIGPAFVALFVCVVWKLGEGEGLKERRREHRREAPVGQPRSGVRM
ncbi:MAG TPA: glycosyltransferase 87 family protein [Thermoanaerobaculia bacterium]|nr:glycosyltransferase 87 family protein [Thermoanaerobaculia bacterium]